MLDALSINKTKKTVPKLKQLLYFLVVIKIKT